MKKSLVHLAATFMAIAIASTSMAGSKPGSGKVSAVADGTVTVANKKTGDTTYKTNSDTKVIKADGSTGSLSDLKSGAHVKVTAGSSADQAAQIEIVEKKKGDTDKTKKADE